MILDEMRNEIDNIDCEMVRLFEKRMNISKKIGDYKAEHGLPIYDAEREKAVLTSKVALLKDKGLEPALRSFYEGLFRVSREYQKR